jgi:Ca2+-binding RTX toxin-like protein
MSGSPVELDDASLEKVSGGTAIVVGTGNSDDITTDGNGAIVFALGGDDMVYAGDGRDTINGGDGDDMLIGQGSNDEINGQAGNDAIYGGEGRDTLTGGAGDDHIDGGSYDQAQDLVDGGDGDDRFVWGPGSGSDVFTGGAGKDTLAIAVTFDQLRSALEVFEPGLSMSIDANNVITFVDSKGIPATFSGDLDFGREQVRFAGIERIELITGASPTTSTNVTVFGADAGTYLPTGDGNDVIHANGGNDWVAAGAGNDRVDGGSGNDLITGESGNDTLIGGSGSDEMYGGAGDDLMFGGDQDGAVDSAVGGAGNDGYTWRPGDGNDIFGGEAGTDTLYLPTVTLSQLQAGLNTPGVQIQVVDGTVTFANANGDAVSASGTLTIGGETITFQTLERMQIARG